MITPGLVSCPHIAFEVMLRWVISFHSIWLHWTQLFIALFSWNVINASSINDLTKYLYIFWNKCNLGKTASWEVVPFFYLSVMYLKLMKASGRELAEFLQRPFLLCSFPKQLKSLFQRICSQRVCSSYRGGWFEWKIYSLLLSLNTNEC